MDYTDRISVDVNLADGLLSSEMKKLIKILNKKQDFCREHKNKKYIEKYIVPHCQMW